MTPAKHNETQQPNLKAFLDNELPLWRRFAVRLHLARCVACREEMRAMQQIGNELRGQVIDPLDPGLRARILATVREMTPEPISPVPARTPILIWSGAAIAAVVVVAVFASRPLFAPATLRAAAPDVAEAGKSNELAYAPKRADQSSVASSVAGSTAPAASNGNAKSISPSESVASPALKSQPQRPQWDAAKDVAKPENAPGGGNTRSYFESPTGQNDALARVAPKNRNLAGSRFAGDGQKMAVSPLMPTGQPSEIDKAAENATHVTAKKPQAVDVVSPRDTEPVEGGGRIARVGQMQPKVVLERAGFDLNGYQFVTQGGLRIAVPFKQRLDAVRFARATDGKMALAETASSPILYLSPADSLVNDAVPGSRWQPLPPGVSATQPLFVYPAPDWERFAAMRWYPNMILVGGISPSSAAGLEPVALPGSHVQIGATLYPDFAAYYAYADAHPDALRLHRVYANAPTTATPSAATKAAGSARGKSHP